MLYIRDPFSINEIDQFLRFPLRMPFSYRAPNLFRSRRIQEHVEYVRILSKEIWCAAAHDNCIPFVCDAVQDLLHHGDHAIGIEDLASERCAALIAATPEHFCEAMQPAV